MRGPLEQAIEPIQIKIDQVARQTVRLGLGRDQEPSPFTIDAEPTPQH